MSSIAGQAPPPTFSGSVQVPRQPAPTSGDLPYQQGTYTIIAPNGQQIQVSADQFAATMGGPPPQAPGGNMASAAGEMAGAYAGKELMGAATPALQPGLMTPAASATESALGIGAGAPSAAPNMTPVQAAAPGLLAQAPGTTLMGSSAAGAMLPYAGIAAGAYTGYQQATGVADAVKGKDLSFQQQAALALPTFGASFLYNPARKLFGGKKGGDQLARDAVRNSLKEGNLVDDNWNLTLADGTKFDIGKDGRYKMDNGLRPFEVDFSQEGASDIVGAVNPLAALVSKGDSKRTSDFAGYFTNAILKSKDGINNIRGLYEQAGLNKDSALKMIGELGIDDAKKAAYSAAVDTIFSGNQLQKAPDEMVNAARTASNALKSGQPAPKTIPAPSQQTDIKVQSKDPAPKPVQVNASPVQKPAVKQGGALSLGNMGGGMRGMMSAPPSQRKTLFGGR